MYFSASCGLCIVAVKVWDFETVDNADITGDMECFEMEPMNELKVGNNVNLRCIVKSCDLEEASIWYAQVIIVFSVLQ